MTYFNPMTTKSWATTFALFILTTLVLMLLSLGRSVFDIDDRFERFNLGTALFVVVSSIVHKGTKQYCRTISLQIANT